MSSADLFRTYTPSVLENLENLRQAPQLQDLPNFRPFIYAPWPSQTIGTSTHQDCFKPIHGSCIRALSSLGNPLRVICHERIRAKLLAPKSRTLIFEGALQLKIGAPLRNQRSRHRYPTTYRPSDRSMIGLRLSANTLCLADIGIDWKSNIRRRRQNIIFWTKFLRTSSPTLQ